MYWPTQWLAFYYDHKPKVGSLLFSSCCGLTAFFFWLFVTCIFCILFFFLFWWFITVHWSSFKELIYLHLCGSGPLHDETKIWRCNPNHRQSISPAFHKSLAKYDDYLPRALALTVKTSGPGTRRRLGTCERCNVHDFQGIGSHEET